MILQVSSLYMILHCLHSEVGNQFCLVYPKYPCNYQTGEAAGTSRTVVEKSLVFNTSH